MPKLSSSVVITIIVLVVIAIGAYLYFTGSIPQISQEQEQKKGESEFVPEVYSIAGKVTSVNTGENSFVMLQPKEERSFTIILGEETEFIRLIFPFDLNNPPVDVTFTPERELVDIEDLSVNDQVFIRSSHAIKTNEDIVDPLEIQILP